MELSSVTLQRIGFFCFPIKHSTHTHVHQPKDHMPVIHVWDASENGRHSQPRNSSEIESAREFQFVTA